MIPVGTLCIVVGVRSVLNGESPAAWNGKTCTVIGHAGGHGIWSHYCRFPCGHDAWIAERCLRPIAPPGDPDAVPHDVSEPELVEVFR